MGCLEGCGVSIHGDIPNLSRHSSLQAAPADSPVSSEIGIDNVLRILPTPSVPRFVTLWLCAFIPEFQRSLTRGGCVVFPGRAGKPNSRLSWVTWSSTTVRVYHRLWGFSKMSFGFSPSIHHLCSKFMNRCALKWMVHVHDSGFKWKLISFKYKCKYQIYRCPNIQGEKPPPWTVAHGPQLHKQDDKRA